MSLDRYRKQTLFAPIGTAGQAAIRRTRVLLVGCGALGSVIADSLTRAGIGSLRIIDRDFVDLSNLHRQILFDQRDVASQLPKAIAAAEKLRHINSDVNIEPHVADLTASNIRELLADRDLILDGTDNFETRYLINDASLETGIPWVSGGILGAAGQVFLVQPGKSPCLRCLLPEPPPQLETCDTAGVLGPAVNIIASLEVLQALQWIVSPDHTVPPALITLDAWAGQFQKIDLSPLLAERNCPACVQGERLWLNGHRGRQTLTLCGRNAVQISPDTPLALDLTATQQAWQSLGQTRSNPFLLWFAPADFPQLEIHLFTDGRAIIKGTEDPLLAKSLLTRFLPF